MTIKTKLLINVVIVVLMMVAIALTGFLGMRSVKDKLFYLARKSTPFQLKTVEYQLSLQAASSSLQKLAFAQSALEMAACTSEADATLSHVKKVESELQGMTAQVSEAHDTLQGIYGALSKTTAQRLQNEADAAKARTEIELKTAAASTRLTDLGRKVKALQSNRSGAYMTAVVDKDSTSTTMLSLEILKGTLKEIQLVLLDPSVSSKRNAELASVSNRLMQNGFIRNSQRYKAQAQAYVNRLDEYLKSKDADKDKSLAALVEAKSILAELVESIQDESDSAGAKYATANQKQGGYLTDSNTALAAFSKNSEIEAWGGNYVALINRLFIVESVKELEETANAIGRTFNNIQQTATIVEKALLATKATQERASLKTALSALTSANATVPGIVAKLKARITSNEEAVKLNKTLQEVVSAQKKKGDTSVASAGNEQEIAISSVASMVRFNSGVLIGSGFFAVIIGLACGLWIYQSIAKPLQRLTVVADQVAEGDLQVKFPPETKDEIGCVMGAVHRMIDNLRGIVGEIHHVTESLENSSKELTATSGVLQHGAEQQFEQISQTAAAITEMSQNVAEVAASTQQSAVAAKEMEDIAKGGKNSLHASVQELGLFATAVDQSVTQMEVLAQQSQEINDIVNLIKDIADQTNLLALNAAIEAARAGDQGRGFAVVADSVRSLAVRTTDATGEIVRTVGSMQQSVSTSVASMHKERESIQGIISRISDSMQAMDKIVQRIDMVAGMVQRVAIASEEQSATSDSIAYSMNSIEQVTRALADSCREVRSAAESLTGLAGSLGTSVKWFTT